MATVVDKMESEANKSSTFSYAQAAKGLPGSEKVTTPSTLQSSRSQSPAKGDGSMSEISHTSKPDARPDSRHNSSTEKTVPPVTTVESRSKRDPVPEAAVSSDLRLRSRPQSSSPEYGVSSTSTLVKDDDNLSLPNAGSSESTWENKSQTSVPVDKLNENQEGECAKSQEQDQSKALPSSKKLQEAPVPVVNFWKQRADEAKAKRDVPAIITKAYAGRISKEESLQADTDSNGVEMQDLRKKQASHHTSFAGNRPLINDAKDRKKSLDISVASKHAITYNRRYSLSQAPEAKYDAYNRAKTSLVPARSTGRIDNEAGPDSSMVQDHESWPTPESAHDDKKKAQPKGEKGEKERANASSTRSHGKNEWVHMPYTPSVVFNTPLSKSGARRGRGNGRAGREMGVRAGSLNNNEQITFDSERIQTMEPRSAERSRRDRQENNTATTNKTPPHQRTTSIVEDNMSRPEVTSPSYGSSFKDIVYSDRVEHSQRTRSSPQRSQAPSQAPYARHSYSGRGKLGRRFEGHGNYDKRRSSETGYSRFDSGSTFAKNGTEYGMSSNGLQPGKFGLHVDTFPHSRYGNNDRRGQYRSYETYSSRERGENRGRASLRDRNYVQGPNSTNQTSNLPYSAHSIGNGSTLAYVPKSPAFQQNQHTNENYRMSSHNARFHTSISRSTNQAPDASGRHNSESTAQAFPSHPLAAYHVPGYELPTSHPLSAPPYGTYIDPYSLMSMVSMQIEYYFSVDNLCKDMFLRKHMDSQGFVYLTVIADFNRIKQLTTDLEIIRSVCYQSQSIEYKIGADGRDRLRRRDGWEMWILPIKDRDLSAQNEGPTELSHPPIPCSQGHEAALPLRQSVSATTATPYQGTPFSDPSYLPANESAASNPEGQAINYRAQANGLQASDRPFVVSSIANSDSKIQYMTANSEVRMEEDTFPDSQIESLSIIVRKQGRDHEPEPLKQPVSQKLSNGAMSAQKNLHELPAGTVLADSPSANGEDTPTLNEFEKSQQGLTHKFKVSSEKDPADPPVRLFWVKDSEVPVKKLPTDALYEYYTDVRFKALSQREDSALGSCPFDVGILYQFWSHFLVRNFNTSMYNEFRRLAFEDASERMSDVGLQSLIKFYGESLHNQTTIRDRVARHFVEIVKLENLEAERPAFKKLRSAWRNGALSLRNRKIISMFIDPDLRTALEH